MTKRTFDPRHRRTRRDYENLTGQDAQRTPGGVFLRGTDDHYPVGRDKTDLLGAFLVARFSKENWKTRAAKPPRGKLSSAQG